MSRDADVSLDKDWPRPEGGTRRSDSEWHICRPVRTTGLRQSSGFTISLSLSLSLSPLCSLSPALLSITVGVVPGSGGSSKEQAGSVTGSETGIEQHKECMRATIKYHRIHPTRLSAGAMSSPSTFYKSYSTASPSRMTPRHLLVYHA